MNTGPASSVKLVTPGMRIMLYIAGGLVFAAGFQLFVLTELTDRFFAWTVRPPFTAAVLGAAYWSSGVLELVGARERTWARARTAVLAVLIFTALTLIVTLLHRDRFHLGAPSGPSTIFLTWGWMTIYAVVPIAMAVLLMLQIRMPGGDPIRAAPLPTWLRAVIAAQAAVMLLLGGVLLIAPQVLIPRWPWMLTALTGRAIGAWLIGLGVAAAQVVRENDFERSRMVSLSSIAFGVLELVALARYPGTLDWSMMGSWLYLLFVAIIAAVGLYGWLAGRRSSPRVAPAGTLEPGEPATRPG
jgi:hypothetical protein